MDVTPTTEFVLVRHAQPEWVRDGLNVVDPPLTELGFAQAECLIEAFDGVEIDELVISPLLRARQTASPLRRHRAIDEMIEPWLEELREPGWHGTPFEIAEKAYREERERDPHRRWEGLPGGENVRDFVNRVHAGLTEFLGARGIRRRPSELPLWDIDEPGRRTVAVAHAGTNAVVVCHLLGLPPTPWEWERFVIGHASVSVLEAINLGDAYTFSLTQLSGVEHLGKDQRTR
jgi:broad specificity phosphatase PhoE